MYYRTPCPDKIFFAKMSSNNISGSRATPPLLPPDSPGSSVSSRLQEEYSELLKHVVMSATTEGDLDLRLNIDSQLEEHQTGNSGAVTPTPHTDKDHHVLTPRSQCDQKVPTPRGENFVTMSKIVQNINKNHPEHEDGSQNSENDESDTNNSSHALSVLTDSTVMDFSQKLDGWLGVLKTSILGEISAATLLMLQNQKEQQEKEMRDVISDKQRLEREVNRLSELVATCEQSMSRKDTLLDNLTHGLAKQRDRTKAAQCFFNWRVEMLDASREKFCEKIAILHHEKQLMQRVLKGWFGQVQTRWRTHVERKCQDQAQGVCRQLSQDYEAKIASLNNTVSELQRKVYSLQAEREQYADSVKKAFMRGVCALNMEAMSAFSPDDPGAAGNGEESTFMEGISTDTFFQDATSSDFKHERLHTASLPYKQHQLENNSSNQLSLAPEAVQMHALPTVQRSLSPQPKARMKKEKLKTKSSALGSLQGQVLAPPMASIVVERHQPVTKQTVGKATASRYPKQTTSEVRSAPSSLPASAASSNQIFKPLAGQTVRQNNFKVVE